MIYPVWEANRCGYINNSGSLVVNFKYQDGKHSKDGVVPVKSEGAWHLADLKGDALFPPTYRGIWDPSEGLCSGLKFQAGKSHNDLYAYVDYDGREQFGIDFDEAGPFSCGRASVRLQGSSVVIDKHGRHVFSTDNYAYINEYKEDRAATAVCAKEEDLYGLVDLEGREVIPAKTAGPIDLYNGVCVVEWAGTGVSEVLDHNGCLVFRADQNINLIGLHDGVVYAEYSDSSRGVFLDTSGKPMCPAFSDYVPDLAAYAGFGSGLVQAMDKRTGKNGYINAYGEVEIPFKFSDCGRFSESRAIIHVKTPDLYSPALISVEGDYVIEPFQDISLIERCGDKVWQATKTNGEIWYYNKDGVVLWVSDPPRSH